MNCLPSVDPQYCTGVSQYLRVSTEFTEGYLRGGEGLFSDIIRQSTLRYTNVTEHIAIGSGTQGEKTN